MTELSSEENSKKLNRQEKINLLIIFGLIILGLLILKFIWQQSPEEKAQEVRQNNYYRNFPSEKKSDEDSQNEKQNHYYRNFKEKKTNLKRPIRRPLRF